MRSINHVCHFIDITFYHILRKNFRHTSSRFKRHQSSSTVWHWYGNTKKKKDKDKIQEYNFAQNAHKSDLNAYLRTLSKDLPEGNSVEESVGSVSCGVKSPRGRSEWNVDCDSATQS